MDTIQVNLNLRIEDIPAITEGILELYPNETIGTENPISDDQWLMSRFPVILSALVSEGRIQKKRREQAQELKIVQDSVINPSISVTLPDGTQING